MNAADYVDQVRLLADAFRPYGWSDASIEGYLIAVGDLDVDLVRRAVVNLVRTADKMPTGAELRRAVLHLVVGDEAPDVDAAWSEVQVRLGTHGRLRTPDWSHPLIGQAVASLGGWGRLCGTDDLTGARIQFHRAYATYAQRAERQALTSPALTAAAALVAAHLPEITEGDR